MAGTLDVAIALKTGKRISGIVANQEGKPVPDASVSAFRGTDPDEDVEGAFARTDAKGSFVLRGLGDGEFTLEVIADGLMLPGDDGPVVLPRARATAGDEGVRIAIEVSR